MCGRFTDTESIAAIKHRFDVDTKLVHWTPRYNVAPSQPVPVILNKDPKSLVLSHWGLQPKWLQSKPGHHDLINIRVEGLATKPTFKHELQFRRCLVIADGFFEWKKEGAHKVPYYIRFKTHELFAFAGLWQEVQDAKSKLDTSCAIITVEPNALMADIHNRMPAILKKADERLWLNDKAPVEALLKMLAPYPAHSLEAFPISTLVNSPAHDVPEILHPAA